MASIRTVLALVLAALALLWGSAAHAQVVAILGADPGDGMADVEAKLESTQQFGQVEAIPVGSATPTLEELLVYDAVLVYSLSAFQDRDALGDTLADYMDRGGGVVVMAWGGTSPRGTRRSPRRSPTATRRSPW